MGRDEVGQLARNWLDQLGRARVAVSTTRLAAGVGAHEQPEEVRPARLRSGLTTATISLQAPVARSCANGATTPAPKFDCDANRAPKLVSVP